MKKSLIKFIVLLISFSIYSQTKIIGEVLYLNSGKKPAVGVEITAEGSSGDTSKENGSYILDFPALKAGATVFPKIGNEIIVNGNASKIELVNTERLEFVNIPEDAVKSPIKIVVCPKGFRGENAKKYYKIIRTETERILARKKRQIEEMKRRVESSNAGVIKKQKELDALRARYKDTIATYKEAMSFASINRDDAKDRVKDFLDLLDAGVDIEEALKELSVENAYLEAIKGGENIDASIKEIETKAKGDISLYRFEQAIQKYDTISIILRNKRYNPRLLISNLHALGFLCGNQKYFKKAESSYQEILKLYTSEGYNTKDYTYPIILNNLGILQKGKNEFSQALENYEEALKITRELSKENPRIYLQDVAMTLNNLGNLQKDTNEFLRAQSSYKEAINIYIRLAKENPKTYLPFVAMTLNNLAVLLKTENKFPQALENYEGALNIYRKLAKENPKTYLPDVALTLNNFAVLQKEKNNFPQALKNYEEALNIYREFTKKNPRTYLPYVASTLNNLGKLHEIKNNFPEAIVNYQESLKIRRKLAEENPSVYSLYVANTLIGLANLQKDTNEFPEALKNYEEVLKIYRELAKGNPRTYSIDVALTLNNLAILQKEKNNFPQALKNYEKALKIFREFAKENPRTYLPYVATTLNNLGNLQNIKNNFLKAIGYYQESLKIRRKLAEENPSVYLPDLAMSLNNLALLQKAKNKLPLAQINYQEALKINRELAKKNPRVYSPNVALNLNNLAIIQQEKNEFPQASVSYEEAIKIYEEFAKKNPDKFNMKLARTYINYALLKKIESLTKKDYNAKLEVIKSIARAKEALSIYDDSNPTKVTYNTLISSLESPSANLNENSAKFTELKNKITILKKQIEIEDNPHKKVTIQKEIIEKLSVFLKKYPENKDAIILLSNNYGSLAWFALFDKNFVLAEKSAKKGLKLSPNEEWINTNLVLAYVLQNKYETAKSIYINMKDKPYGNGSYSTTFIEDIEALEKSGITHKDFERVERLLKD